MENEIINLSIWHILIPNLVTVVVAVASAIFTFLTAKNASKAAINLELHREKTKAYLSLYGIFSSFFNTNKVDYKTLMETSYRAMLYTTPAIDRALVRLWQAVIARDELGHNETPDVAQEVADSMQNVAQLLKIDTQAHKKLYSRRLLARLANRKLGK